MKFGADDLNIFLLLRIFSNMQEQEEVKNMRKADCHGKLILQSIC